MRGWKYASNEFALVRGMRCRRVKAAASAAVIQALRYSEPPMSVRAVQMISSDAKYPHAKTDSIDRPVAATIRAISSSSTISLACASISGASCGNAAGFSARTTAGT